jgi:paraquat-inducible protein A
MNESPRALQMGVIGCRVCGLVVAPAEHEGEHLRCPRCHSLLRRRRTNSVMRTWSLLLASVILYVPANLLPVMEVSWLGQAEHPSTILGGVVDLWRDESYDVALVVFVASVAVPCAKFLALAFLLLSIQLDCAWARRTRARLYRMLELVGYWSMLDVMVVGLVASLVQFGALGGFEPGPGIFFYSLSVILTMLAAHSLDPRLIWDSDRA